MRLLLILISFLPFGWVKRRYLAAGARVGDAESYSFMGEPGGIEFSMWRWRLWETAIIRRGYGTYSLDQFIDYGGWGRPLPKMMKVAQGEESVKHSAIRTKQLKESGRKKAELLFSDGTVELYKKWESPSTESEKL
jgi:hypothetical protein